MADSSLFYAAGHRLKWGVDPFGLHRFIEAQQPVYADVLNELLQGRKRSHWIWFVFPQVAGLGFSSTSRHFAIGSREEAEAYLEHPILGARLRECTDAVNSQEGKTAREIFGWPDDLKFRSSMTLFHVVSPNERRFQDALYRFYDGKPDERTLALLGKQRGPATP